MVVVTVPNDTSNTAPNKLYIMDPATPTTAKLATYTGSPPANAGCGFGRCSTTDKFYLYNGSGSTTLTTLSRPTSGGNFNGSWTFGTESFIGTGPTVENLVFTKFLWIPPLKCFAYYGVVNRTVSPFVIDTPVYLYRPAGT